MHDTEIPTIPRSGETTRRPRRNLFDPPLSEFDREVGKRLRMLRIARDVTREELAALVGFRSRTVEAHERGLERITARQLACYAKALKVKVVGFLMTAELPVIACPCGRD